MAPSRRRIAPTGRRGGHVASANHRAQESNYPVVERLNKGSTGGSVCRLDAIFDEDGDEESERGPNCDSASVEESSAGTRSQRCAL
eukprot:1186348-Prorocentrum_minimum.AAC.3